MTPKSQEEKKQPASPKVRKAMKETLALVAKLGAGAAGLLARLKKDKSPEAMIATIDVSLQGNEERRGRVSGRVGELHRDIANKKREYASASKAGQRLLESELRGLLSTYKAAERELNVLVENERVLNAVKGRLNEIMAYDLRGISEALIDEVTDDIDERAAEAEGILDATTDLEKAGRRRDREPDSEELWAALEEFDEEGAGSVDAASEEFDDSAGAAEKGPRNEEPEKEA